MTLWDCIAKESVALEGIPWASTFPLERRVSVQATFFRLRSSWFELVYKLLAEELDVHARSDIGEPGWGTKAPTGADVI